MEKETNKIFIFIVILLIMLSGQTLSQIKTDTISILNDRILLFYPQESTIRTTNYEEGSFKDVVSREDTALIVFHYGSMVTIPLLTRQGKTVTSEYILANDLRQTRGFYYSNGEKKYFREDNVYKYGFNVYYTNVPENKLLFYESLLNSLKYKIGGSAESAGTQNDYISVK